MPVRQQVSAGERLHAVNKINPNLPTPNSQTELFCTIWVKLARFGHDRCDFHPARAN